MTDFWEEWLFSDRVKDALLRVLRVHTEAEARKILAEYPELGDRVSGIEPLRGSWANGVRYQIPESAGQWVRFIPPVSREDVSD